MGGTQVTESSNFGAAAQARALLRASRAGSLATVDAGQPFASLVTPATAMDGSVLLLLSGLSPHTRHLRAEPRCSIMVVGAPSGANPQTAPRLSLTGGASPEPSPALKARWVALHPYAAFYADLGDFQLWRLRAEAGQFVGGFASAHRLRAANLQPPADAVAALEPQETALLSACNDQHGASLDLLAGAAGGAGTGWRMVACDPDGCDLGREESVIRVVWPIPAGSAAEVLEQLRRLADAARNHFATRPGPAV